MRFERLEIQNFLSYGPQGISIDLTGLGAVLITGRDRSTGGHNGVGKSAIVDAFVWTLYGKPFRPISIDNVVNFASGGDTACALEFTIGSDHYRVERYRKHAEFGNQMRVFKNGQLLPLMSSTQEEQKRLDRILGISRGPFVENTVYTSDTQIFFTLSPQKRFQLLESRLNIEVFGAAASHARRLVKMLEEDRLKAETKIDMLRSNLERLNADRSEYEAKAEEWENNREQEQDRIRERIVAIESELAEQNILLEERRRWEREKEELKESYATHIERQTDLVREIDAIDANIRDLRNLQEREKHELRATIELIKGSAKERIKAIQQRLEQLNAQECPVCERPLGDHGQDLREHLENEIASIAAEVERKVNEASDRCDTNLKTIAGRIAELEIDRDNFKEQLRQVEDEIATIQERNNAIEQAISRLPDDRDVAIKRRELEEQKDRLEYLSGNNPFQDVLRRIDDQIEETQAEIERLEVKLESIEDELYYYKLWADAFKNDLKYYAVSSILPVLNERLNVALRALFPNKDVGMKVHSTMEISIRFDGIPTSYWNLSQGERKRFDIALFAALYMVSRYVDPRSTSNVIWFDEIFDSGLDQQGISATLQLLRNLGADTFFVITHRAELTSIFDSVLELEKVNGITRTRV